MRTRMHARSSNDSEATTPCAVPSKKRKNISSPKRTETKPKEDTNITRWLPFGEQCPSFACLVQNNTEAPDLPMALFQFDKSGRLLRVSRFMKARTMLFATRKSILERPVHVPDSEWATMFDTPTLQIARSLQSQARALHATNDVNKAVGAASNKAEQTIASTS